MEDSDDSADAENSGSESRDNAEIEIIWSVGDHCQARWSGDNQLYSGVVKKLKHTKQGRVVAWVKFNDYGSDDCEEVDVRYLQRAVKIKGQKSNKKTADNNDALDSCENNSGFFSPFTGIEDMTRLEEKYGHESDSDSGQPELLRASSWISPTPYQTKGKVSEWKVRSPAKSQAVFSQRRKSRVVKVNSPKRKTCTGRRATANEKKTASSTDAASVQLKTPVLHASDMASTGSPSSDLPQKRDDNMDNGLGDAFRRKDADSDRSATHEGLFEGFDEDDMEKPNFSMSAPLEKFPFCLDEKENIMIPAPLNQYLRDYQREGIQFLYSHYHHNRGAVLGDDMGLGKTVQVIGFLSALMGKQGNRQDVMRQKPRFIRLMSDDPDLTEDSHHGPFLIIGPGSVLYNWLEELDTWAHFTVRKYHGPDKASCLADTDRGKVEVVVTTFETCRDNITALNEIKWDAVIVDEVHRIKGLKAQTTQALRTLKCVRRYGLTGTALQNNMSELWCILDWAQPNVLGSAEEFDEDFVRPIELGQKQNATKRELAVARKKKEEFARVRSLMLLRRTKKLIADQLPVKTDRVVFCQLSPLQTSVYKAVLSHPDLKIVLQMNAKCSCGSGLAGGKCCLKALKSGRSSKSVMFTFMHVLLKASNHIALLIPHAKISPDQLRKAQKLCDIAFKDHPEFMDLARDAAFRTLSDPKYCGKMKVLQGMLSVFAKTHCKVLVFSYSTRLLDILEQHIMSEGHEYRRIDGNVTGRRRQEIVREFNSDPNIFLCLVSTKAGGLGLNMTGANKVVIFDPNWNPSHDLQAQDRAYRIGQRRDVEVYRLITAGSIEENIYLRQIYKQQLDNVAIATGNARRYFKGIQGDASNKGELFGINNMFQLRTGDSCLTMEILNRNAKVEAGLTGYDVADYIPSWREQEDQDGNSTGQDSDGGSDESESSDEETLKAFKDLFRAGSDDEEKEAQTVNPQKKNTGSNFEPKPSTSGLQKHNRTAPSTSRKIPAYDSADSDSSLDGGSTRTTKPTTRQRKLSGQNNHWSEETSATKILDFLDEDEEVPRSRGKALKTKRPRGGKSKGGVSAGVWTGRDEGSNLPVQDSLITPSFSSVSSVFEQCGVIHVHDNPQVVGASRGEDHMTRCAMHDVFELSANTQAPADLCDPMSQPSEVEGQDHSKKGSKGKGGRGRTPSKDHNTPRTVDHSRWHILVGQTPTAIRKKHWNDVMKQKNCEDEVTLAKRILMSSPEERLTMLKDMYRSQLDQALHSVVADILSKPADQSEETVRCAGQTHKTVPSTPKTQPRGGKRKTSQQKTVTTKKQGVRQRRRGRGLLYDDDVEDDTQPCPQQRKTSNHQDDDASSDGSGFDIGAKVSPARVKATRRARRGGTQRSGRTKQSVISPSLFDRTQDVPASKYAMTCKVPDTVDGSLHEDPASAVTVDVDGLLSELGRKRTTEPDQHGDRTASTSAVVVGKKRKGGELDMDVSTSHKKATISVLDDIFCESEDCEQKRKPPPSRGEKSKTERHVEISEKGSRAVHVVSPITSTHRGAAKSSGHKDYGGPSTSGSSDLFSDLMNNSTLRDDDVDCFGEPSQWKKQRRTPKPPPRNTGRLLQESLDDYLGLFESERVVKKQHWKKTAVQEPQERVDGMERERARLAEKEKTEERDDEKDSDFNPSGSLF